MRIVTDEFEIFELELVNIFNRRVQSHPRQRPAIAGKLLARLIEMVVVEMQIAKSVNESRAKLPNYSGIVVGLVVSDNRFCFTSFHPGQCDAPRRKIRY
jgi:hypothetical protein